MSIPSHMRFWGIDSGVRHSVGGADYGTVRAATFMGRAMLRAELRKRSDDDTVPEDVRELKHLVDLSPSLFSAIKHMLPNKLAGSHFLKEYGSHDDAATEVDPSVTYDVRSCTAHPVHEHFRVGSFRSLLASPPSTSQLTLLGELMYQSHASYSSVGLGSDATDHIVSHALLTLLHLTSYQLASYILHAMLPRGRCGSSGP